MRAVLTTGGGTPIRCTSPRDRPGKSQPIVPAILQQVLADPDPDGAASRNANGRDGRGGRAHARRPTKASRPGTTTLTSPRAGNRRSTRTRPTGRAAAPGRHPHDKLRCEIARLNFPYRHE